MNWASDYKLRRNLEHLMSKLVERDFTLSGALLSLLSSCGAFDTGLQGFLEERPGRPSE